MNSSPFEHCAVCSTANLVLKF